MTHDRLTVLILGGYGAFGGRLARRLAGEPRLTLVLAGRSFDKASRFCATLPQRAIVQAAALDRDGDIMAQLGAARPHILIDASGPFQTLGPKPYRVAEACLRLGIHYLDFADASDFVLGIGQLDAAAQSAGLFALSGLSTFPALSGAMAADLAEGLDTLDDVTMAIGPSPFAELGLNAIAATASYAGKPVRLRRHGRTAAGFGLTEVRRRTIAPPGALPLRSRRFSLVDVPDLRLLPLRMPIPQEIWVGAGPGPASLHRGLNLMAWMVRLRLLRSLLPLAGVFWRVSRWAHWGEDRGGFLVEVMGRMPDGTGVQRSWHLTVDGQDGPSIPCIAAEALVRNVLAGRWPRPGARPADDAVRLSDVMPLLATLRTTTGRRWVSPETAAWPLYRRVLGDAWERLPRAVQVLHGSNEARQFAGRASVERGSHLFARLIATVIGLPAAGLEVPVTVDFAVRNGVETWRRTFAGRSFASRQYEGHGRFAHLVVEQFGPFAIGLAPVIDGGRLRIVVRRWGLFGLPLPAWLAPGGETFEREDDGRFHFHVEIGTRLTGLIVRYRGWLLPTAASVP